MSVTIRPAAQADFTLIESIARRTWPDTFAEILSTEQIDYMLGLMYSRAALRAQTEDQGHRFLLLEEEREAIGYVSYQLDYLPRVTKVHKLYLLPQRHGHGHGRTLLDAVRDRARAGGQARLRLDVNFQNAAVAFYQHYGFEIIDRVDTDIGEGFVMEDYVMERDV